MATKVDTVCEGIVIDGYMKYMARYISTKAPLVKSSLYNTYVNAGVYI